MSFFTELLAPDERSTFVRDVLLEDRHISEDIQGSFEDYRHPLDWLEHQWDYVISPEEKPDWTQQFRSLLLHPDRRLREAALLRGAATGLDDSFSYALRDAYLNHYTLFDVRPNYWYLPGTTTLGEKLVGLLSAKTRPGDWAYEVMRQRSLRPENGNYLLFFLERNPLWLRVRLAECLRYSKTPASDLSSLLLRLVAMQGLKVEAFLEDLIEVLPEAVVRAAIWRGLGARAVVDEAKRLDALLFQRPTLERDEPRFNILEVGEDANARALSILRGDDDVFNPRQRADNLGWLVRAAPSQGPGVLRLASAVTADDPWVRTRAIRFFEQRPTADDGGALVAALASPSPLFDGVPDPWPQAANGEDLRHLLAGAVAQRARAGDESSLKVLRAEAQVPNRAGPVTTALLRHDTEWFVAQAESILQTSPGAIEPAFFMMSRLCIDLRPFLATLRDEVPTALLRQALLDTVLPGPERIAYLEML